MTWDVAASYGRRQSQSSGKAGVTFITGRVHQQDVSGPPHLTLASNQQGPQGVPMPTEMVGIIQVIYTQMSTIP